MIDLSLPVAVIAPCGAYNVERFEAGLDWLREIGLTLDVLEGQLAPHRYLAASDDVRSKHLNRALCSEEYGAVWIARGGYGMTRILHRVPWHEVVSDRAVFGFSDVTGLFAAMRGYGVGRPVHAPVVHSLGSTDEASLEALRALVLEGVLPELSGESWVDGDAAGELVGGNLCLVSATAGTAYQLDASGCVLALEEVGEPAYRVDRMVQQLISAGIFDGVAAVVLGEFRSCRVPEGADYTLRDMLMEHLEPLGVPVVGDAPFGHGPRNVPFVWGHKVSVSDGVVQPKRSPWA